MHKKVVFLILVLFIVSSAFVSVHAQMMNYGSPSANPSDLQQQEEETQGKKLLEQLQNKQTTCQKLTYSDFEKIGEYVMSQRFSNTNTHIQMNNNIKNMMGDSGEENMHIKLGLMTTGCNKSLKEQGGDIPMMGGYRNGNMMYGNFGWGFGFIHLIIALVVFIDLILVGIWLWKQIKKK